MSETTEAPAAIEPETPAPALADTPAPEATTEAPAAEPAEPEAPAQGEEPWRKVRIEQLSREKNDARRERDLASRERDEARAALEAFRAGQNPDTAKSDMARIEVEARKLAQAELDARDQDAGNAKFVAAGRKEFADFDSRCEVVAAAGGLSRPEFMAIIRDMDDNGPRVVMHLADRPAEMARLVALPPHRMGLELARLERSVEPKAPPPKPVSQVPKPVTPVGGVTAAEGNIFDPNISMAEYTRLRQKQIKAAEAQRR